MNLKKYTLPAILCLLACTSLASRAQFTISTSPAAQVNTPAYIVVNDAPLSFYAIPTGGGAALAGIVWTSDSPNVLKQTNASNVFYAASEGGPVTVTATNPAGVKATASITVTPGIPQSLSITPLPSTLAFGETAALSATGNYLMADGSTKSFPVTAGIAWTVAPAANATIAANVLTAGTTANAVTVMASDPIFPAPYNNVGATVTIVAANPGTPQFNGPQTSGNQYVDILGKKADLISVYQVDSGYAVANGQPCGSISLAQKTPLQIVTSSTSTGPVSNALAADGPNRITLSAALLAGTGLCLQASSPTGPWSNFINVNDPNDFGRVRTYATLGMQISNQLPASASGGAAQSSTAGEYLETGFVYSLFRAAAKTDIKPDGTHPHSWHPGVQSVFDVRLSPIPVSAPAGQTSAGSATPTITSLNVLSSQQSVRVNGQLYFPFRIAHWQDGYNVTTLAPLAKAGFITLLNPTSSSTAGTGISTVVTTTSFSPTYSFFGYGGRLAWDRYPRSTDKAPQMVTQLDVTLAKYSNLPSYLCTADSSKLNPYPPDPKGVIPTTPVFTTACGVAGSSQASNKYISRTLAYRLDIEGIAKLPGYPFVLGVAANLAQYKVGHDSNIDYMNKPGNDIRIFIGITIPLNSLGSLISTGSVSK